MLFLSCVFLSLWVGYMFGTNRQIKRGDKELESAHADAKFWRDLANRQSLALRKDIPDPPVITELDLKK